MHGVAAGRLSADLPEALRVPHRERLDPDHPRYEDILTAHDRAIGRGEAGYLDPETGLFVLTAATLWDHGRCCEQGCRHCPYLAAEDHIERGSGLRS